MTRFQGSIRRSTTPIRISNAGKLMESLKTRIRDQAQIVGFDAVHFTAATSLPETGTHLDAFIANGWYGDMDWMERTADRRREPTALWPDARSVIVLALNYGPANDPFESVGRADCGSISVYARGKDYHDIVKKKLKQVAGWLHRETGADVKVFVDTAPVMEKPLAAAAGLGWQGKHTNLVSLSHGSWLFLGSIFTTLELPPDAPETDHCGTCQSCLDACPTDAFPAPYKLDARRCISYLTIEHKGHIAPEFRRPMGNRIFGCDDCLAVCPWNKFATVASEVRFHARDAADSPPLEELLALDDAMFRERYAGSPIKRTGRDRFIRNVLIAAGNSGDMALLPQIENLLGDESPLVRAMAVWASGQLMNGTAFQILRSKYSRSEKDAHVQAEWHLGCVE